MRSIVHLAVYDTLADWEPGHAIAGIRNPEHQREPGRYDVRVVGATTEPVRTLGGMTIVPDMALDELDPARSAMLILPGAAGWEGEHDLSAFTRAARACLDAGTPVAAICGATGGLAAAGLLDDRAHTSNAPEYLAHVPGYGGAGRYVEADAVRDRGVITASAMHPVAFAREIFLELDLYVPEVVDAWFGLFSTGDPSYFHKLEQATAAP